MDQRIRTLATCLALAATTAGAAGLSDCGGFTTKDAAGFLKVPAASVARRADKLSASLWTCHYAVGKDAPAIVFSLRDDGDPKRAAAEMERYRDNLMATGELAPFKSRLPKGAYSDIMGPGLGDEAVWTDINGSLAVRQGAITLQVMMPKGKLEQIRLAQAVLAKH